MPCFPFPTLNMCEFIYDCATSSMYWSLYIRGASLHIKIGVFPLNSFLLLIQGDLFQLFVCLLMKLMLAANSGDEVDKRAFHCISESDGKRYRDQFLYAEQELAAARGREEALQGKILKEVKEYQEQLKKQMQLCNELEVTNGLVFGFEF